ncbi:hypothetical protein J7E63_15040 [Bacillus sp. ISL-75]|jgi:spore germination protein|nr:hypothetical protein [Bacillus sp. ISL-75]MBT2728251.1 hypothetical protein [Bacillus sp. ISL-75]
MKNIMIPVIIVSVVLAGCVQKKILDDVNLETGSPLIMLVVRSAERR